MRLLGEINKHSLQEERPQEKLGPLIVKLAKQGKQSFRDNFAFVPYIGSYVSFNVSPNGTRLKAYAQNLKKGNGSPW